MAEEKVLRFANFVANEEANIKRLQQNIRRWDDFIFNFVSQQTGLLEWRLTKAEEHRKQEEERLKEAYERLDAERIYHQQRQLGEPPQQHRPVTASDNSSEILGVLLQMQIRMEESFAAITRNASRQSYTDGELGEMEPARLKNDRLMMDAAVIVAEAAAFWSEDY